MGRDVLERLRSADPAKRMPDADPDDRERLRRAIVATPLKPRDARHRWWRRGRGLAVLLAGTLLLGSGTVYAMRQLVGSGGGTPLAASSADTDPGRIVFTKITGFPIDIFAINPDGTGLKKLADSAALQPAWSPDGSLIAYVAQGLWVINADGSGKRRVATKGAWPAWSPDGEQIVCVDGGGGLSPSLGGEGEGQLLIVNADGSGLRAVSEHDGVSGTRPVWAPDGRILFLTTTEGELPLYSQPESRTAAICSVEPDGSDLSIITAVPIPTSFSLSPDGRWLLIWDSSADRLVRLLANGQGMEVVVVDRLSRLLRPRFRTAGLSDVESSWSWDGRRVVFSGQATQAVPGPGRSWDWTGLYTVRIDGVGLRKVPHSGLALDPAWQPR